MLENAIVQATGVSKLYRVGFEKYVYAIKDINLVVNRGEFISIMGPSGSGKSTLLNCISTIDLPTKGIVKIEGTNIKTISGYKLNSFRYNCLGFIFQNYNLLEELTIYENIAISLAMHKEKKSEIQKRVNHVSKQLNIDILLNKLPKECSGGQQQKISIARALVTKPQLIVADEPTGNLDSRSAHDLLMLLTKLNEDGKTIVIVTHDSMVASYSKRVLYINDGIIEKEVLKENKTNKEFYQEIISHNTKKDLKK